MEILRMFVVMAHLSALVVAAVGVVLSDLALFHPRGLDLPQLRRSSKAVALALCALWLTGLLLVWIDTGFVPAVVLDRPKLVAKLGVATLLTLNGWLLHRFFFARLAHRVDRPSRMAWRAAALSAISGASWLYAGFLGLARPLTPMLKLWGFMGLYLIVLSICGLLVMRFVHPRLLRILHSTGSARSAADVAPSLASHAPQRPSRPSSRAA